MSWDYSALSHRPEHDVIKDALYRRLSEFSKRELEGISWSRDDTGQYPHKAKDVLEKETHIKGNLPSGKSYCRADLTFRVGDQHFAFEVKASNSDAKRWPEQAADYRSAGFRPIIATTLDVVAKLGAGHRLVTDSNYVIAHDHNLYFSVDNPPAAVGEFFQDDPPFETLLDHCPDCGFHLVCRAERDVGLTYRCEACDYGLR